MDANLGTDISLIFADSGPLATTLNGFEPRDGQRQMAAAVAGVIESGGTLLAEAGTGTGKTLAYLIPAILSRQRVLVSTGTKNLQEQIFFKDLPALRDALRRAVHRHADEGAIELSVPAPVSRSYREASREYVRHGGRLIERPEKRSSCRSSDDWAKTTETGDRAELARTPEDLPLWKDISAEAETCLGTECPRYGDCFVTLMRQRAAESDVVIVNHHLLCADASVRKSAYGEVIPVLRNAGRRRSAPARGRRHAVLRRRVQQLPRRRPAARRRPSAVDARRRRRIAGRDAGSAPRPASRCTRTGLLQRRWPSAGRCRSGAGIAGALHRRHVCRTFSRTAPA